MNKRTGSLSFKPNTRANLSVVIGSLTGSGASWSSPSGLNSNSNSESLVMTNLSGVCCSVRVLPAPFCGAVAQLVEAAPFKVRDRDSSSGYCSRLSIRRYPCINLPGNLNHRIRVRIQFRPLMGGSSNGKARCLELQTRD